MSPGDTLRALAEKIDSLEGERDELRRAIRDALGRDECICDFRLNHPQVTRHTLQCNVLRAAMGADKPKADEAFRMIWCENGCSDMYLQQMNTPGSVVWLCTKCGSEKRVLR